MKKIKKTRLFTAIFFILCLGIMIITPSMAFRKKLSATADNDLVVLSLWQIDGFEGGKGSRAAYLQSVGEKFTKKTGYYVIVTSMTSEAALNNLKNNAEPDLISFGAGICGLENYLRGYRTWCHGGYCFLSLNDADFSDISDKNTVVNGGTENFAGAAALFCGLNDCTVEKPTAAYVKLINGEYKYLLGTQRDVYRLKPRGVQFNVKPVTEFNDLYQNISVTSNNFKLRTAAERFIDFLIGESENLSKIGLIYSGMSLYEDEMHKMEGLNYSYKLVSPSSEGMKKELENAIENKDLKKLKNLLN